MNNFRCEYCNIIDNEFVETPNLKHYGKIVCAKCGKWFKWVTNPDKPEPKRKIKLAPKEISKLYGFDSVFCFFCQRGIEQLGEKETFEVDHISELHLGGEDSKKICRCYVLLAIS